MAQWVKLCSLQDAPVPGSAAQFAAGEVGVCLANNDGDFAAVNNWCPHRQGPLAEGWLEDGKIVCPWHAWGFDLKTGECPEEKSCVAVYPLEKRGDSLFIEME